jgi:hypothetical protein
MNDEDFARDAFAAAFHAGPTGEPPALPDVESLVTGGRRASRQRHGVYAAGTTALAGVVTAGVVTAPTLLGFGGGSPSVVSAGAGGTTAAQTASKPSPTRDLEKPVGVACATPPAVDWTAVVAAALPASVHAVADPDVSCLTFSDGSRRVDAGFTLSVPTSTLQIEVQSGGRLAEKLAQDDKLRDPTSASPSMDPSALQALTFSRAGMRSPSATLDRPMRGRSSNTSTAPMRSPRMSTVPRVGNSRVDATRNNVVLPAPLGPSTTQR